jgi:hypothetical protein
MDGDLPREVMYGSCGVYDVRYVVGAEGLLTYPFADITCTPSDVKAGSRVGPTCFYPDIWIERLNITYSTRYYHVWSTMHARILEVPRTLRSAGSEGGWVKRVGIVQGDIGGLCDVLEDWKDE